jgi:ATP-dependent exoDNAse (exonuclease V) alpha subunit
LRCILPRRFGLDPRRDVQVLCPMHRGPAGAGVLNEKLQEALTSARPGAPERRYGGRVYRVGDKVTQLRNNYDKRVFNGSVGVVTGLSLEEQELRVFMDRPALTRPCPRAKRLVVLVGSKRAIARAVRTEGMLCGRSPSFPHVVAEPEPQRPHGEPAQGC